MRHLTEAAVRDSTGVLFFSCLHDFPLSTSIPQYSYETDRLSYGDIPPCIFCRRKSPLLSPAHAQSNLYRLHLG